MAQIVVGVDDSPGGRAALLWALREAELRHAGLEVVYVWSLPLNEGWNAEWPVDETALGARAREFLDRFVADGVAALGSRAEVAATPLECEAPAFGLLERAAGADLLVVGSRGRGGFTGLLLGSVSTQCVHHATCPVVVVKAPPD